MLRTGHLFLASAVALALVALVPSLAAAHSAGLGTSGGDTPIDAKAAAELASVQSEALAELPLETAGGSCLRTEHVDGIGDSCRTRDGMFRVRLANGATLVTHGADAPDDPNSRAAAAPHLPDTQAALDGASAADIECTSAVGDRRIELVYARPSDKPDRSAALAGPMRMAIYQASAFLDAESQAIDASQGRRLRVLCAGGEPVIHTAVVRASGTSGGDFDEIVDDLVAQGYPAPEWNSSSPRRFIIFYDDEHYLGSAGIGTTWIDDKAGPGNLNNYGARYAIEFDWSSSHLPHWDVMLHEITHNMGAVSDNAPDSSRNGHCIDGLDVMCYDDGGDGGTYVTTACIVERYDCGADTYFNPNPTPGSWLAQNWNVGSTNNYWLATRDTGWDDGGVPDLNPPTAPSGVNASSVTKSSFTLSWNASTDDRSLVRYRIEVDYLTGGSWVEYATLAPISATTVGLTSLPPGTTYRFRLYAYDQAGNLSAPATGQVATLHLPPEAPSSAGVTVVDEQTLDAAWVAGEASAGVRGHEVELQRGVDAWQAMGEHPGTTARFSGLDAGASYRIRVRTVANDGATSTWRMSSYVRMPGTLTGGDGALTTPDVYTKILGPTRANVSWSTSPAATMWTVRLASGGRSSTHDVGTTSAIITNLQPGATYHVSVIAHAEDGRASDPGSASFTMPRDRTPPSATRFMAPKYVRNTMRVFWRPATDAGGVRRYELQRKVGKRWKPIKVRGNARTATIPNIRRRMVVTLRVRAIDMSGNAGRWTTTTVRRR